MVGVIESAYAVSAAVVLLYFLGVNTCQLALISIASVGLGRHLRRSGFAGYDDAYANPFTQPVSLLIPAYNEAAGVVESVHAMLALRYPDFEVIVIDDGPTDGTFDALREAFGLVETPRVVPQLVATTGAVRSVHVPTRLTAQVVVVRKENGGKSDALNVGLNLARHPLVCMVDADSLLDADALLRVAKPFADDPERVVAAGGVIRAANGCEVIAGRVVDVRMPRQPLAAMQIVEYLRALLLGRTAWSQMQSLLVISGAFGLFRRDLVLAVGGMAPDTLGEDAELVVRLHRHLRERGQEYRIVFVAEPVSWTEVPSTLRILARQRRRWHRGMTEIALKHRRMLFNRRYGRIGLVALPYAVLFEVLAPVVEVVGLAMLVVGLVLDAGAGVLWPQLDVVSVEYAVMFLLVAYAYGVLLSLAALAAEEFSFARYRRWSDLAIAVLAAGAENLGYRQLTAWWRIQGSWQALRRHTPVWGEMERLGLGAGRVPQETGSRRPP